MKKMLPVLLLLAFFAACSGNDNSDKTTKKEKSSDKEEDNQVDDAEDSESNRWTSTQKSKGSKRYVQLIETENNSIYEKNSEKDVKKLADCMIEKIADRMTFSEYETIMDNFDADKKVSDLSPTLKRKATSINPFFKKCREEAGVDY